MPYRSWCFLDTAEAGAPAHLVLSSNSEYKRMFIVDVENMKLEWAQERNHHAEWVFPYELRPTMKACM